MVDLPILRTVKSLKRKVNMKEEIRNIVDLSDHSVDLSTYCPEKGLYLELPVLMNKPKNISKV